MDPSGNNMQDGLSWALGRMNMNQSEMPSGGGRYLGTGDRPRFLTGPFPMRNQDRHPSMITSSIKNARSLGEC
jgi:hypothetical protein